MFINLKEILRKGSYLFFIILLLLFTLVACQPDKSDVTNDTREPTSEPDTLIAEEASTTNDEKVTEPSDETLEVAKETTVSSTAKDPKLDDFTTMDLYLHDYNFNISYDENLDPWERVYSIDGSYDLNGDGQEDIISALLYSDFRDAGSEEQSFIEVNGIRQIIDNIAAGGQMYIIDLDNRDGYKEIAIHDKGPSNDNTYLFYRYDGEDFYHIGTMDINALMNGMGSFISWFDLADNFSPSFYSEWEEIEGKELVKYPHDIEEYTGKTYYVSGEGFFVPLDFNPGEDYYTYTHFSPEYMELFNREEVKLLDVLGVTSDSRILNWFYVERQDGQKGLVYFWIGD